MYILTGLHYKFGRDRRDLWSRDMFNFHRCSNHLWNLIKKANTWTPYSHSRFYFIFYIFYFWKHVRERFFAVLWIKSRPCLSSFLPLEAFVYGYFLKTITMRFRDCFNWLQTKRRNKQNYGSRVTENVSLKILSRNPWGHRQDLALATVTKHAQRTCILWDIISTYVK